MNFKRILAGVMTGTMVVAMGVPALADDESEYRAYLFFQTGDYSFRNVWHDGDGYGLGDYGEKNTDEVDYYTVHAWSNGDLVAAAGTFTDAVITGDGTYTVSVTGLEFTESTFADSDGAYRQIGVSTDIAWDNGATITIDQVVIGDSTFDTPEVYNDGVDGDSEYLDIKVESPGYNKISIGSYDATSSTIEITFTVSGLAAGVGDSAAYAGDTAPVVYLGAIAAVAGLAMVVSKKKEQELA